MARNITYDDANQVSLPVPAGTKSGDPVRVGGLNGVALTNRALSTATPPEFGGGNVDGEATVKLNGAATFDVDFALAWAESAAIVVDGVVRQGDPGQLLRDDELVARARLRRPWVLELAARLGLAHDPDLPPLRDLDGIAARLAAPARPVRGSGHVG